jgi:hypothetical protein
VLESDTSHSSSARTNQTELVRRRSSQPFSERFLRQETCRLRVSLIGRPVLVLFEALVGDGRAGIRSQDYLRAASVGSMRPSEEGDSAMSNRISSENHDLARINYIKLG